MFEVLGFKTQNRTQFLEITQQVQALLAKAKVSEGFCIVYCMHTTAGVLIQENSDPSVQEDLLSMLEKIAPKGSSYKHSEGNSDAHAKSAIVGCSAIIPVKSSKLLLGTWQGIFLAEFDGPRNRQLVVQIFSEK